jgi:hypothetical protein
MTVATSVSRTVVHGNGAATTFAFPFKILASGDLVVTRTTSAGVDTTLALGTHYSVSGVGAESGGSITYPLSGSALPAGDRLTLRRVLSIVQETDLTNQGPFYAEVHESAFDRALMVDQQLQEQLNRALLVAPSDTGGLVLPNAETRAGRYLVFDGNGDPSVSGQADTAGTLMSMEREGNGSQTDWTLPAVVSGGPRSLVVAVDGVVQPTSSYGVTGGGGTIAFTQAPPAGSAIDVRVIGETIAVSQGQPSSTTLSVAYEAPKAAGIMLPLYLYPNNPYSDGTMLALLALIRAYKSVPVIAIVNPADGPGTVWDGNYAALIRLLKGAGATVSGYVSTAYGARAEALVKADIDQWQSLYATTPIDGIFLDEQPWDTAGDVVPLYVRYTAYCHDRSLYPVVGNPGTNEREEWFASPTADIIVCHETGTWPVEADMHGLFVGGHSQYPTSMRAALVYAQATLDEHLVRRLRRYVDWIYVTNDVLSPNPWDSIPAYMRQLFAALAETGGLGDGPQALTSGTSIAWDAGEVAAATVTLGHNATLGAPSNLLPGRRYRLVATQDGTGSRTLAFNAVYKFVSGTTLPVTGTAGQKHVLEFVSDGTSLYCTSLGTY